MSFVCYILFLSNNLAGLNSVLSLYRNFIRYFNYHHYRVKINLTIMRPLFLLFWSKDQPYLLEYPCYSLKPYLKLARAIIILKLLNFYNLLFKISIPKCLSNPCFWRFKRLQLIFLSYQILNIFAC